MALKSAAPFLIFPPSLAEPPSRRPATEVRFSRWNNANAQPFLRRQREQKEIEDDLRRHRRFESADRIAEIWENAAATETAPPEFKSHGTPSSPSAPSIPGKKSKYSKPPQNPNDKSPYSHPAFRRIARVPKGQSRVSLEPGGNGEAGIAVGERGISYKIENAPFEFQYSYTETPKVKPLALREPPYLPFGPSTMPRPWTGRAPLPASKKKLPEFDSFKPPPPGKKGVKPVQAPGPFLAGSGPRYQAKSREEILGEPLTEEEVKELIKGCLKTSRQLNIGRDGLTHNMLENIHAHWKRRRVCKIKCKGVCTVDMDNVRRQLEEKTGGKIIYSRGGVLFLFRGRNYNSRTRPKFPLMLWKPTTPVYPRLVQRVPEGLTLEEATEKRKQGRKLQPICKLGKNGVYTNLVKDVKEAFEECELVRINCQGMNKSDCRKIGAKLQDLVPCILLSFEYEHILMWRGKEWRSVLTPPEDNCKETAQQMIDGSPSASLNADNLALVTYQEASELGVGKSTSEIIKRPLESIAPMGHYCSEVTEPTANGSAAASLNSVGQAHMRHQKASELSAGKSLNENIESPRETMPAKGDCSIETAELTTDGALGTSLTSAGQQPVTYQETVELSEIKTLNADNCFVMPSRSDLAKEDLWMEEIENLSSIERNDQLSQHDPYASPVGMHDNIASMASTVHQGKADLVAGKSSNNDQEIFIKGYQTKTVSSEVTEDYSSSVNSDQLFADSHVVTSMGMSFTTPVNLESEEIAAIQTKESFQYRNGMSSNSKCLEGVMHLLKQAIENGTALALEDESLDANFVYEKSVSLAKSAPPGPIFRQRMRKVTTKRVERQKDARPEPQEIEGEEIVTVFEKRESEKKSSRNRKKENFRGGLHDLVPRGSLGVDELAKLLS